jgi:enolase
MQILDSRGNPTVEVDVNWKTARSAGRPSPAARAPARTRPGSCATATRRYLGKGVLQAVDNVNDEDRRRPDWLDAPDQIGIDQAMIELDGTPNKKNLGANAILGVSLAVAKPPPILPSCRCIRYLGGVGANLLPAPMMNIINGGSTPTTRSTCRNSWSCRWASTTFSDALRCGVEVFHT